MAQGIGLSFETKLHGSFSPSNDWQCYDLGSHIAQRLNQPLFCTRRDVFFSGMTFPPGVTVLVCGVSVKTLAGIFLSKPLVLEVCLTIIVLD
jgi:hypothetical protein